MDKFMNALEESATIKDLLEVVNKKENRSLKDYIKYYIPFFLCHIVLYIAVVLIIVFGINKFIPAFVSTFTVIDILFIWGTFDKYFALKIFKYIRAKEIEHFSK